MKKIIFMICWAAIAAVTVLPSTGLALRDGNEGTGGGDPVAAEFAEIVYAIASQIERSPHLLPNLDSATISALARRLYESVNTLGEESLIVVQEAPLFNQLGIAPVASFSRTPIRINVHRASWTALTGNQKIISAAAQLFGIVGLSEESAAQSSLSVGARANDILSGSFRNGATCSTSLAQMVQASMAYRNAVEGCVASPLTLENAARVAAESCIRECGYEHLASMIPYCQRGLTSVEMLQQNYRQSHPECLR